MKSILLKGAAGVGKTSLAEYFAEKIGAEFIYYLCNEWTTVEELMFEVDIAKIATKNSYPYKHGPLLKAVELSCSAPVVLLIDEIDKAKSRIDTLFLDFLQNCRVTDPNGNLVHGNAENIFVFITTNEHREIIDPLQRRVAKVSLDFLPPEVETSLILNSTDNYYLDKKRRFIIKYTSENPETIEIPEVSRFLVKIANRMRKENLDISLYELKKLYQTLFLCRDRDEVEFSIELWLVRNDEYRDFLNNSFRGISNLANTLWGILRKEEVKNETKSKNF